MRIMRTINDDCINVLGRKSLGPEICSLKEQSSIHLGDTSETIKVEIDDENADGQSEVKSELELIIILYFEQERAEIRQHSPTPDPLEVNINALDEAWFLQLEELELIKAKGAVDSGKRVQRSPSLSCTVCEEPLDLHQRGKLHRSFQKLYLSKC